ncbi:MAG: hypothetical protein KDD59_14550, partial [Bdellovibrionales bacterium]|nr:hypothetical protein [Bdellovibrionales bacterium]
MKTSLFLILVYFGAFDGALAQNYSPVQGWSQDLRISEADLITEVEAETAFEYFYGDDGITCKGQIDNLIIDRVERNNAKEPVAF